MRSAHSLAVVMLIVAGTVHAADFHVDPVRGDDANDGSREKPWRTLQHLFEQGRVESREWESLPYREGTSLVPKHPGATIAAGDTIWLHSGFHGDLVIQGYYNSDFITIAASRGETPRFNSIRLQSGSHWRFRELKVCPADAEGERPKTLMAIAGHGWGWAGTGCRG